ncbi:beta-N-acetylhexosaminidase [Paenibacillus sp. CC-CFT747]|nr:beta-N-acetylhexosaminidase [Paenibacillus sp. CC-CFT747]
MKRVIHLQGDRDEIALGVKEMAGHLKFSLSEDSGIPLIAIRTERQDVLELEMNAKEIIIRFGAVHHFFRGLSHVFERWEELAGSQPSIRITEYPQFDLNGAMFDCSRNAVMHVEGVKRFVRIMAAMGLNMLMLYTEDTYEIEGMPYFGYMRGRYTQEELKEIDAYAALFGMEVIPCIQTLAHLAAALKWNYAQAFTDTEDILLVGEPLTYEFIENMITAASAPFRSKRIHIGMDEAHRLGLGQYLEKNGLHSRFDLMKEHLDKVLAITRSHGLEPMIWSDMYFRLGSKHGWYYDLDVEIPEPVIEAMPKDVRFVYWDYYHTDPSFYEAYLDIHRSFGSEPLFAGGIWTWNTIAPNYGKTIATTNAALAACKQKGVREVFATFWGNDGNEASYASGILGLQWFAEHGYAKGVPDAETVNRRVAVCSGDESLTGEHFLALTLLDEVPGVPEGNLGRAILRNSCCGRTF